MNQSSDEGADVGGGISPWSSEMSPQKDWNSPSRRKADDAWLQEHVERNLDLQSIRESISCYAPSERHRASPVGHSPSLRGERVYLIEADLRDDDLRHRRRPTQATRVETASAHHVVEVRSINNDEYEYYDDGRSHGHGGHNHGHSHGDHHQGATFYHHDRRHRHDSQESFESAAHSSTRSSTRKHTTSTRTRTRTPTTTYTTTYDCHEHEHEPQDSGYGSYGSRASNGQHERAKTEPYQPYSTTSPSPRILTVRPPSAAAAAATATAAAATTSYNYYYSGFGPGPVDIIPRAPKYAYASARRN